jgi:hypothetical protein
MLGAMWSQADRSESMHLDGGFFHSVIDEEGRYLGALVSLKLNNLAHLLVIDEGAVACELLIINCVRLYSERKR